MIGKKFRTFIIDTLKHDKQQLNDKYFHILLFEVQEWINKNPDYKIYAGMGIWSLNYKSRLVDGANSADFHDYKESGKWYSYVDDDEGRLVLNGLRESFQPIGELIEAFEAEDIYLGQNVEPQDTGETQATQGEFEEPAPEPLMVDVRQLDYKHIASEIVRGMTSYRLDSHQQETLKYIAETVMVNKIRYKLER